jgi:hypothetical protein
MACGDVFFGKQYRCGLEDAVLMALQCTNIYVPPRFKVTSRIAFGMPVNIQMILDVHNSKIHKSIGL